MMKERKHIKGHKTGDGGEKKMFLDDSMIMGVERRYEEVIKEKDREIQRLKGMDTEKDAEICAMIRDRIMHAGSAEQIEQLTAALANMKTVTGR